MGAHFDSVRSMGLARSIQHQNVRRMQLRLEIKKKPKGKEDMQRLQPSNLFSKTGHGYVYAHFRLAVLPSGKSAAA